MDKEKVLTESEKEQILKLQIESAKSNDTQLQYDNLQLINYIRGRKEHTAPYIPMMP